MRFKSGQDFIKLQHKAITVLGMSGVGKTTIANLLQRSHWFHYSVDYRIGTRYMDEHITDNFKKEAMQSPFLRDLLLSDSIYIRSNITFDNLAPLSTYLGKPGNPAKGGIPFVEYMRRQTQHREAEIRSLLDVPDFIRRARDLYDYENFICDSGGSLCEVIDFADPKDPVVQSLINNTLLLYIEGTPEHTATLVERFRKAPKPMYYQPEFLEQKWAEYKTLKSLKRDDDVDPDDFAAWGFAELVRHRIPLYEKLARDYGYSVRMQDIPAVTSADAFVDLIARTIDQS
jgi:hypothetical protein